MILLDFMRWIFIAMLLTVMWRLWPTAWRALRSPLPGDFAHLLFFGLALNRLWFIGKSLAYPNPPGTLPESLWTVVGYVFGIALEIGVLSLHRWERRRDA